MEKNLPSMCEHLGSIPTTGMVLKKETTNPLALDLIPTATRKSRQRKRREKKKIPVSTLFRHYFTSWSKGHRMFVLVQCAFQLVILAVFCLWSYCRLNILIIYSTWWLAEGYRRHWTLFRCPISSSLTEPTFPVWGLNSILSGFLVYNHIIWW